MNNTLGWRYRLTDNKWFASFSDMDSARDAEYGASFGPFESKDEAREYVRGTSELYDCEMETK